MASRPWSPAELAVIEQCAGSCDMRTACRRIRGRTHKAIKVRMAKMRAQLGLGDGRRVDGPSDDSWIGDAALASQMLLAATLRVGVWS